MYVGTSNSGHRSPFDTFVSLFSEVIKGRRLNVYVAYQNTVTSLHGYKKSTNCLHNCIYAHNNNNNNNNFEHLFTASGRRKGENRVYT